MGPRSFPCGPTGAPKRVLWEAGSDSEAKGSKPGGSYPQVAASPASGWVGRKPGLGASQSHNSCWKLAGVSRPAPAVMYGRRRSKKKAE